MDQVTLQGHAQQKMRQAPAAPRRYDGQAGNPLYDPAQGGHYGMFVPSNVAFVAARHCAWSQAVMSLKLTLI